MYEGCSKLQNIEEVIDIKLLDDIMQMCLGGAQKK